MGSAPTGMSVCYSRWWWECVTDGVWIWWCLWVGQCISPTYFYLVFLKYLMVSLFWWWILLMWKLMMELECMNKMLWMFWKWYELEMSLVWMCLWMMMFSIYWCCCWVSMWNNGSTLTHQTIIVYLYDMDVLFPFWLGKWCCLLWSSMILYFYISMKSSLNLRKVCYEFYFSKKILNVRAYYNTLLVRTGNHISFILSYWEGVWNWLNSSR